jgi:hypothetical protein
MRGVLVIGAGIILGTVFALLDPPQRFDDGDHFAKDGPSRLKLARESRRSSVPTEVFAARHIAEEEEGVAELPEPAWPAEPPLADPVDESADHPEPALLATISSSPSEGAAPNLRRVSAVEELPPPAPVVVVDPPGGRPRLHSLEIWGVRDPTTGLLAPIDGLPFVDSDDDDPSRLYVEGEYVLCWQKEANVPVLATTGPPASNGILGQPGVSILFGGDTLAGEERSGARFRAGWWIDCEKTKALEGSYFFLGQRSARFDINSVDTPVIARPFFNLNTNAEYSELVARPGIADGRLMVTAPSSLWNADLNLRCKLCKGCDWRLDLLAGLRTLSLDEGLLVVESLDVEPGVPLLGGNRVRVFDRFDTHNQFWGGQLGLAGELRHGCFFLNGRFLLGLGNVHQAIDIDGGQVVTTPAGNVSTFVGGLLAERTNIGAFNRDRFAVLPELNLHVGVDVNRWLRAYVGYNFLYCSSVARPGDQIDRGLDVTNIPNFFFPNPPPASRVGPVPTLAATDFWVQGISFGLECRY